jgi:hypothetical protein
VYNIVASTDLKSDTDNYTIYIKNTLERRVPFRTPLINMGRQLLLILLEAVHNMHYKRVSNLEKALLSRYTVGIQDGFDPYPSTRLFIDVL